MRIRISLHVIAIELRRSKNENIAFLRLGDRLGWEYLSVVISYGTFHTHLIAHFRSISSSALIAQQFRPEVVAPIPDLFETNASAPQPPPLKPGQSSCMVAM